MSKLASPLKLDNETWRLHFKESNIQFNPLKKLFSEKRNWNYCFIYQSK